jgi:hypothetical protein
VVSEAIHRSGWVPVAGENGYGGGDLQGLVTRRGSSGCPYPGKHQVDLSGLTDPHGSGKILSIFRRSKSVCAGHRLLIMA